MILNKQKLFKKIAFLVKMTNFRPNHKILAASQELEKKIIQKFLEKIRFNENPGDKSDFGKSPFSTHSNRLHTCKNLKNFNYQHCSILTDTTKYYKMHQTLFVFFEKSVLN
jgi:hypothetical protein